MQDKIRQLEEEKNALLDYIEESVNHSTNNIMQSQSQSNQDHQQNRLTLHDQKLQLESLQKEKAEMQLRIQ